MKYKSDRLTTKTSCGCNQDLKIYCEKHIEEMYPTKTSIGCEPPPVDWQERLIEYSNSYGWNKTIQGYLIDFIQAELTTQREEIKRKIEEMKYRKTKYGYRQKGKIGTATNITYCDAYNSALDELLELLSKE
jgi:hypothetical protein